MEVWDVQGDDEACAQPEDLVDEETRTPLLEARATRYISNPKVTSVYNPKSQQPTTPLPPAVSSTRHTTTTSSTSTRKSSFTSNKSSSTNSSRTLTPSASSKQSSSSTSTSLTSNPTAALKFPSPPSSGCATPYTDVSSGAVFGPDALCVGLVPKNPRPTSFVRLSDVGLTLDGATYRIVGPSESPLVWRRARRLRAWGGMLS